MGSEGYTLKEMVSELRAHNHVMDDRQVRMEGILEQILEQAKKTNGRITVNEDEIKILKAEHTRLKTVGATIATIAAFVWGAVEYVTRFLT